MANFSQQFESFFVYAGLLRVFMASPLLLGSLQLLATLMTAFSKWDSNIYPCEYPHK
jgi:hypothetical protein